MDGFFFRQKHILQYLSQLKDLMKPLAFEITLTQHEGPSKYQLQIEQEELISIGASFWEIQTDLKPIYENFNILSYFSSTSRVVLHDAKEFVGREKFGNVYEFSFNKKDQKYYLFQLQKDDYREIFLKPGEALKIKYSITKDLKWPESQEDEDEVKVDEIPISNIINVQFTVVEKKNGKGEKIYEIVIGVQDQDGWILNNIYPIHYDKRNKYDRISEKRRSKRRRNNNPNNPYDQQLIRQQNVIELPARLKLPEFSTDLQYFYMEPEKKRNKVIKKKHFALALQGGGCKGVTYIGAYKAILDHYQKEGVDITSIIGSSAGGIIGLAVCCRMAPEDIVGLCEKYLSRVTDDKTFPQKNQQTDAILQRYFKTLEQVLRQYNILEGTLIDVAKSFLEDKQVQQYLFDTFKIASGLDKNEKVLSLFEYEDGQKNICGLLSGKLMTGEKVGLIAESCLVEMVESKRFEKKVNKYFKGLEKKDLKQWAKKLTMKQLYDITGIEFTCTSVDVSNHILRYFNHKTTPGLPVVNAVQMTGAFPVAFQATYWKKEWGKYYIHYDTMRREVDLEGSKFTDGGMLANFPIDCIDNEEMRPMYFSHVKDSTNTIMYGVGLQQCVQAVEEKKADGPQFPLSYSQILSKIGVFTSIGYLPQLIASKLGFMDYIIGLFSFSQQKEVDVTERNILTKVREIPLFDFIYNLLLTFTLTKDKLAEESFRHQSYEIIPSVQIKDYINNRQQANQKFEEDLINLTKVLNQTLANEKQDPFMTVLENFKFLQQLPQPTTQEQLFDIESKVNLILSNLMFNYLFILKTDPFKKMLLQKIYEIFNQKDTQFSNFDLILQSVNKKKDLTIYTEEEYNKIHEDEFKKKYCLNRIFYQLEIMKTAKMFVLCDIRKDYRILLKMIKQTTKIFKEIFDEDSKSQLRVQIKKAFPQAFIPEEYLKSQRVTQSNKIKEVLNLLNSNGQKIVELRRKVQKIKVITNQKQIYTETQKLLSEIQNYSAFDLDRQNLLSLINNKQSVQVMQGALQTLQQNVNRFGAARIFNMEVTQKLLEIQNCFITHKISDINKINERIGELKCCLQLIINYRRYNRRGQLNAYIKRSIHETQHRYTQKLKGLHIVIQTAPFSEIYFFNIIQFLKLFKIEMRSGLEKQQNMRHASQCNVSYNLPITSITMSNIQSIAAILYTSDLRQFKINQYVCQIKELVYEGDSNFVKRLEKRLKDGEWAKKVPVLLRGLTAEFTKQAQQSNVFDGMQKSLSKPNLQWDDFLADVRNIEDNAQNCKQRLAQVIEQSLNCVLDQVYKTDLKSITIEKKLDQIAENLALAYNKKDYDKKQSDVKPALELGKLLAGKFVDFMKNFIQSSPYVAEQIVRNVNRDQKKDAWKGLLLGEMHSSLKVKRIVQRIMLDLGLSKNTTLQEFYRVNSKKITLNFSVINTQDNCVQIYNHETRPYMPVWAAVVASSSLLQFFRPLNDRRQWSYKLVDDPQQRKISKYFGGYQSDYNLLYSADSLRKLPIDLLTNRQMCKKIYQEKNSKLQRRQAFLIFDFANDYDYVDILKKAQVNKNNKNMIKISNINLKDVMNIKDMVGKSKDTIFNSPFLTGNAKRLELYVDSHDKLVSNLYKNDLINLPIRLGTLDFHLMCQKINGEDRLTNICNDTIMQSYFAMREKVQNQQAIKNQTKLIFDEEKWIKDQFKILLHDRLKKELENCNQQQFQKVREKWAGEQFKLLDQRWREEQYAKLKPKKFVKRLYFRVESKNSSVFSKQEHKLVIRFLSMFVPNKSFKQNYKLYYKPNNNAAEYKLITDEYLRLNTVDSLSLKIEYVDIIKDESLKVRYKIKTKSFKFDLRNFSELANAGRRFGYVYSLEYTENAEKQLEPDGGFRGDYRLDYIIGENERNISIEQLRIPIFLQNAENVLKYEKPVCKHLHELKVVCQKPDSFFGNQNIKVDKEICIFSCETCKKNNEPKYKYQIQEKYQVKLQNDNSIRCTGGHDHELVLSRKLTGYPLQISFIICDRCKKCNPLGFFRDNKCGLDICFTCVFGMIKNQI